MLRKLQWGKSFLLQKVSKNAIFISQNSWSCNSTFDKPILSPNTNTFPLSPPAQKLRHTHLHTESFLVQLLKCWFSKVIHKDMVGALVLFSLKCWIICKTGGIKVFCGNWSPPVGIFTDPQSIRDNEKNTSKFINVVYVECKTSVMLRCVVLCRSI